ncbi:YdbH domain-containing protein [Pseudomonas sp. MAP12]|uniref:YdbH domain-containing protein n=1 Tax=Geopseudomonas aromaticivorans TaxID=2849492 RepID=A0ABS6N1Z9_9GAMM|nr:YdbH domain-containing protein [Pseudomonas aromaticivorans]MBV2134835.1 YdbH domain-containing protein [Pseudomonas aromaticivorans]
MAAGPQRWRRFLLWLTLALLLAGLAAAGFGWQQWRRVQQELGIVRLDWQGLALSRHGLQLQRLELEQRAADGRRLQLGADALQLDWRLSRAESYLQRLAVQQLQLDWQAPLTPTGQASRLPGADALGRLLAWLPREVAIERIAASLPCPDGRCRLDGQLQLQQPGAALLPASLRLELQAAEHHILLTGDLGGALDAAHLQLAMTLDDQPHLALGARLAAAADGRVLHGTLQLPARPPVLWLHDWLAQWLGAAAAPLRQVPDALQLDAEWTLQLPASWQPQDGLPPQIQLDHARLQARLPRLQADDLELRQPSADLRLSGRWQAPELLLSFAPDSQISVQRLDSAAAGLRLDDLRADLAGLQLTHAAAGPLQLAGPLALHTARLQQAQLQAQRWDWQGRLAASTADIRLAGTLRNAAGLAVDLHMQHPASGALQVGYTLAELALASGNPLAKTLVDWPALLELASGRLQGHGTLQLAAGSSAPSADLVLQLLQVGGIYDRSELKGLDARLTAQLRGQRLELQLPELRLASLNPGVPLGPLQLRADYQAELAQPLAGRLQLWQADSGLFGGQLRTLPTRLDLARRPLALTVQVNGLELAELLKVYPAEGLSGSGTLDGQLPLRIERDGVHIDRGQLQARAPGGVLQLRSERIRAFGRDNPALQLATTALEDFRYDRLESQVDYAAQGTLRLALRLQGRNPALEGGRPVNFTINLEENVPALLTSLQLSGRVNDAIQRRVQQRLQPRH